MSETMRRSWLLVPMSKPELIAQAAQSGADVIVLDLIELVAAIMPRTTSAAQARAYRVLPWVAPI